MNNILLGIIFGAVFGLIFGLVSYYINKKNKSRL